MAELRVKFKALNLSDKLQMKQVKTKNLWMCVYAFLKGKTKPRIIRN